MMIIVSKEYGLLIDLGNGSHARFAKPSLEASNEIMRPFVLTRCATPKSSKIKRYQEFFGLNP